MCPKVDLIRVWPYKAEYFVVSIFTHSCVVYLLAIGEVVIMNTTYRWWVAACLF